jgi:hypothetical protein
MAAQIAKTAAEQKTIQAATSHHAAILSEQIEAA